MVISVICPNCKTTLGIPEAQAHQAFRCPKCKAPLPPARPAVPVALPVAPEPPAPVAVTPVPIPTLVPVDADEGGRPRRNPSPSRKPAGPPPKKSFPAWLLVGLAFGGFLLLGTCGIGLVTAFLFLRATPDEGGHDPGPNVVHNDFPGRDGPRPPRDEFPGEGPPRDAPPGDLPRPPGDPPRDRPPARGVSLALPPTPPALPIRPPEVNKKTTLDLPEAVHNVTVGGGGRFLLLHFQTLRKLGVFDVNEAKIVGYVTLDEETVRIAAGMNKLALLYPGRGTLERYDLLTRKKEKEAKFDVGSKLLSFCMGDASDGPLLVSGEQSFHLVDLETLKPMELPQMDNERGENLAGHYYWSGGPGRVFGATHAGGGAPSGIATLTLEPTRLRYRYEHDGGWFIIPGPDGKNIFVGGHGIKLADLSASPDGEGFPNSRGNVSTTYLPAHHGPFFMQVHVGFRNGDQGQPGDPDQGVTIYLLGSRKPLAQLGNIGVVPYSEFRALGGLGYPGSIHLIPRANLLVVVPAGRDKLLLHPVNLDDALQKSGIPFLFVNSTPPTRFQPGQKFEYAIETKSKAGGVSYVLDAGPEGMKVGADGKVEWTPPANFKEAEVSVIVRVRAGDGRQIFHSFLLANTAPPK